MAASIRRRQIAVVKQMLNFNDGPSKGDDGPQWKALVYDRCGQDIISPLLSVKELRDMGVTLHLLLDSPRDPVPEVPAIYFVLPTEENVKRISKDLEDELYDSYYFNFITALPRARMDEIATTAIASQTANQIHKVFDQYVHFLSLEEDMFVLRPEETETVSYYDLNRGGLRDDEMTRMINSVADGLFSFFVTMGAIPIIRCPRDCAAERVALRLAERIREDLRNTRNSLLNAESLQQQHPGVLSFQRPLLVLLDRQMDLATPLHHTWTYQALAHDVLSLHLNRVEIVEPAPPGAVGGRETKKTFDLNSSDKLWNQLKGRPFPEVAEAIQEELEAYKSQEGEIGRLKAAMGFGGDASDGSSETYLSDTTAQLTSTVSSLPEMLEKKRLIDVHTNVATALLDRIKDRKLDVYFETEEKLMGKTGLDKSLLEIIQDPAAGLSDDKLRMLIIACLSDLGEAELSQYEDELRQAGCDVSALAYIRRNRTLGSLTAARDQGPSGGGTKTVSMFGKLMSQASQFAMEGVKNLVPKTRKLPVTRITDALMEGKNLSDLDSYFYDDPKLIRKPDAQSASRAKYSEAVVFMVGGGNYIEYQNLQEYAKDSKRVIYGSTQLVSSTEFLTQLSRLGSENA